MIPLIKIRLTFLKRKNAQVFFNYIFVPMWVIMAIIFYSTKIKNEEKPETREKQVFEYENGAEFYLFKNNDNFENISSYIKNTSLVVNDITIGTKLVEYIKDKFKADLKLYSNENELNYTSQNILILDYNSDKNSFKFTFKQKEIINKSEIKYFPFNSSNLSTIKSSDIFEYQYNNKENYTSIDFYNKLYISYQAFLSKFLIEKINNKNINNKDIHFNFGFNSFPESVKNLRDYSVIELFIGYIISLQFTFLIISFGMQMLDEKEQKLEKLVERQGISQIKYLLSWFINFLIISSIAFIACIVGGVMFLQNLIGLYLLTLILYILGSFSMVLFFVTVSKNKKYGIILINLFTIGGLFVGFILIFGSPPKTIQIIFAFLPNTNIFSATKLIVKLQFLGRYSLENTLLESNGISFLDSVIMFIIEIIFYLFFTIFIRRYQNSGLNFINFIKSIFCRGNNKNYLVNLSQEEMLQETFHEELTEKNKSLKEQNLYLNINKVTRKYDQLIAVNNFNGELFKNEIFCLLGHNGAGKTTLIKMISGAEEPDSGNIFLNNISVVTNKNYLFQNIGLCQQEDIFFDYLTVNEHLKYMMEIKGIRSDLNEINTLINKIGLIPKRDSLCKTLSGGEKRKLCVALALIGNSELVILDEPTSGMDIISKKALWDFLKEFKKDKIIILTTHSLDEAEYLGDRIGIMRNGYFICSGTSSFLKSKYPCGFNINLLINSNICTDDMKEKIYNELVKYEPNLEIKISSKSLFSLNIQSNNKDIKEIFDTITKNKEEYGIEDYTVSSTSLEDVFLKLNHKITINEEKEKIDNDNLINLENINIDNMLIEEQRQSFFFQLGAHIKRGYFSLGRNIGYNLLELLMSIVIVYFYILLYYNILGQINEQTLSLTKLLDNNDIFICENNKNFFKESYAGKDLCSIHFKSINNINNINNKKDFIENIYQNALGNIGKSGICVTNINSNNDVYEVINSEIPLSIPSYIMANSMLIVSAFLKKEYDINAVIFDEIAHNKINSVGTFGAQEISMIVSIIFVCTFSLSFYLGSVTSDKIKERAKNIKQILYINGTNMWSYWLGFLVVDISKMIIFCSLIGVSIYLISGFAFYFWMNLLISIISFLIFIYSFSFLFEKEESGQKFTILIINIIIVVLLLIVLIISTVNINIDLSFLLNRYNFTIFDITPFTAFILSSFRIAFAYYYLEENNSLNLIDGVPLGNRFGILYRPKFYIFTSLIVHLINIIFYSCLLFLLESGYIKKFINYIKVKFFIKDSNITFSNTEISEEFMANNNYLEEGNIPLLKDIDDNNNIINTNINKSENKNCIEKEIQKVNDDLQNELNIKIVSLKKTYWLCCKKNIRAINNLYLGLDNTEKFGLLGFNGSGKTTTFKTITREILFDSGNIYLFGRNINTQFKEIRQYIGYCPQENPLFDYMKVKEIIKFYLSIKNRYESVEHIAHKFGIEKYLDTYCINLSGGNKRKLSFAIALMCDPKILLLDEPSTGVDPESRRIMWKNIMKTSNKRDKFNMILTTHSMEEAEVLCDTVSWLKSGNFISIGNPEKLKIEFSAGYKLHIKFKQLDSIDSNLIEENEIIDISNKLNDISGINNFTDLIENNKELQRHVKELEKVINLIKDKCSEIVLKNINKDYSFDFNIQVNKENQKELFIQILDMKNTNKLLSEINISMESLENILTKL